jgi:hypothetical protein
MKDHSVLRDKQGRIPVYYTRQSGFKPNQERFGVKFLDAYVTRHPLV